MVHASDLILIASSFIAGALNSVAGGGSFLTFPTLIFYGVPPVVANASNTVALFPGALSAAWAYRRDLSKVTELNILSSLIISLIGGLLGAALLLKTPESSFVALIPYLLLFATLLFTFGGRLSTILRTRFHVSVTVVLIAQFFIAIYGGYFGAGIGILMLSMMLLFGMKDIHQMNALKSLLGGSLNGVAVILFISANAINWRVSLIMMIGGIAGGFIGASWARQIEQDKVRGFISLVGLSMSTYFFFHY